MAEIKRKLPWLLLFPLHFLLVYLAGLNASFIERVYSRGVYPVISSVVSWIFSIFPFSFAELLLYALTASLAVFIVLSLIKLLLRRMRLTRFISILLTLAIIAGFGLVGFNVLWGFNYYRQPLASSLELDTHARSAGELYTLCLALSKKAGELREGLNENGDGVYTFTGSWRDEFKKIPAAYAKLGEKYVLFSRNIPSPKGVTFSIGMSYAGIAGIFIPFTGEANLNIAAPDFLLISSAAHESAHLMGIAREDEANFVSYLACASSGDAEMQYSGVMLALIHCGNALASSSGERYAELWDTYTEGMARDLENNSAYWEKYEGPVEQTVNTINDSYLKANAQQDGVKSYGRMVDLMLAYYDANGLGF